MHWRSHILRYAIRRGELIKYVHKNFKRRLPLTLLIKHGRVFNVLKSVSYKFIFIATFLLWGPHFTLTALYQLKVGNSFSIINSMSGCSLRSIMFVIWAWLSPVLPPGCSWVSRLLFPLPVCWRPPPQPASPLLAATGHSLAHNSHNILSVSLIFTSASSQNAWLGCKYFESVCSILILHSIPLLGAVIHYEMRNRMKYGIRYTGSQPAGML